MPFPQCSSAPAQPERGRLLLAMPGMQLAAACSGREERAACYPESGQRACCQGEEGLPLLFFWFPTCPCSWNQVAQDTPPELPQPRGKCSGSAFPQGSKNRRWQLLGASSSSHCHEFKQLFKEMSTWAPEHPLQDSFLSQGSSRSVGRAVKDKKFPKAPWLPFLHLVISHPGLWPHIHYLS